MLSLICRARVRLTGWHLNWLLGNGWSSPDHKLIALQGFWFFCMKNRHTSLEPYKLLSLCYIHKLMHCTIIEVLLLLSHRYLTISLCNVGSMGVTYFAGWCWTQLGYCNGRNQPPSGHGPATHMASQPWDLQCERCCVGQSWYGQWPHPDPAKTDSQSLSSLSLLSPPYPLPDMPDQSSHTGRRIKK